MKLQTATEIIEAALQQVFREVGGRLSDGFVSKLAEQVERDLIASGHIPGPIKH